MDLRVLHTFLWHLLLVSTQYNILNNYTIITTIIAVSENGLVDHGILSRPQDTRQPVYSSRKCELDRAVISRLAKANRESRTPECLIIVLGEL